MSLFIIFAFSLFSLCVVQSQGPAADLITNLPGLTFNTNYKQYSGYLTASPGHHLHYWLTESQNNPSTDPVVLWLNGGPGCSSLDGLFYELGPFHVYDNATLWDNAKNSWNNYANIIYLEAPVCVGYSYQEGGNICSMNDNTTANDNYLALLDFFKKFPSYQTNDFYVTGESYGGVYVPTLTLRILQGNANNEGNKINIKGFAVGNGVTKSQDSSNSIKWFYYHHGMIAEEGWNQMLKECCDSPYTRQTCNFYNPRSNACRTAINNAENGCCGGINPYDLYGDCYHVGDDEKKKELDEKGLLYPYEKLVRHLEFNDKDNNIKGNVPCVDSKGATTYLNEQSVKTAIHIPSNVKQSWSICSNTLNYQSIWSRDMDPIYDNIFSMDKNIYMTMYNGDTDTVCNFLGDEWFIDDRNASVTANWREWYINDVNGRQVGGWTKDFDRIHFVTVRGAGHMVPQYRPIAALKMFHYFLQNKNLD